MAKLRNFFATTYRRRNEMRAAAGTANFIEIID